MLSKSLKLKEIVKNGYLSLLVIYMIIREVIPLQFIINSSIVSFGVFFVGFGLILWDLLTDRECLKGKAADFFAVFIVISVISSVINYKYGIGSNIKCIAAMVLEYFIFFPTGFKTENKKTFKVIFNTLIITLFILVVISIGMYMFSIDYSIMDDYVRDQGFDATWGRLWGVFNDPNVISYVCLVSVFASGYFIFSFRKVWAYILYGINILAQMLFIMLCQSRSAEVLIVIIPVISAIYPLICYIKTNKKRAYGSLLVAIVTSGVLYGMFLGMNKGMPHVKASFLNEMSASSRNKIVGFYDAAYKLCGMEILNIKDNHIEADEEGKEEEAEEIVRKDDKSDYSNGRIARWMGGIEVFKTTPIVGTSPRNAIAIAKERTPKTVMGKYGWITHCSYLEILVNTGILGFIAMMGCLVYIAVLFLKAAWENGFKANIYIAFLCFITIAAGVFFVSDVFFVFTINAFLFFYLLGILYGCTESSERESIIFKIYKKIIPIKNS